MPQITYLYQPTTDDNLQKRKRRKETQNTDGNKTDQTPSRPHPLTKRLEQQYLL